MECFKIQGGVRLSGSTRLCGAKNAVLPILAAAMLARGRVVLTGCPDITDVRNMLEILRTLGCAATFEDGVIEIDPTGACRWEMPSLISKELRSSIFMLGPVLARFGQATFTFPGGCEIGLRPINLHLAGLRQLGANITEENGLIHCKGALHGDDVHLDTPSVGATENVMMAAVLAKGRTVIYNAAKEPEIVDLARFIKAIGGKVRGAGTDCIAIDGVEQSALHGAEYTPMSDRILAGTLMAAAGITCGDVYIDNVRYADLGAVCVKMKEMGVSITRDEGGLRVKGPSSLNAFRTLETQPFPGFPTDMQAQMMAMSTVAGGVSMIVENLFESRFGHAGELMSMGADIVVRDRMAIITGVNTLYGATVTARDLRGGAALTIAGLKAQGETVVENIRLVDRGYERFEETLRALGANVVRTVN